MLHPAGITRVLLVTDATHMTRATRNFKRHSFTPIAAPTGYLGHDPFRAGQLVPSVEGLRRSHIALREWLGMLRDRLVE